VIRAGEGGAAPTRPAVLLVGNFLSASGRTPQVCEMVAIRLMAAGWEVRTTSSRHSRLARLLDMVATIWRERDVYRVAHVDVFSGPAFLWAEVACWALRRAGRPYGLTLHGGRLPAFAQRNPARVRRLLRSAAWVTAPSEYLRAAIRSHREDVELLPNALDTGAYPFRLRTRPAPRIVWVRSFHDIYNPALAVQVMNLLRPDFPEIRLTMVGPDKDGSLDRTRAEARRLGVAEHVDFPGGVPKSSVPEWLDRGDIFLNTTSVDNTPVSVLEAMACGLCVVSTNVGGIPYLLDDGRDALLVRPGDPVAMAEAVRRLLTETGLAEELSRKARAKAERLDWARVLPRWKELLGGGGGRAFSEEAEAP
jgi:glycosyltransferase involved in cell wall biosynthesis